MKFAVLLTVAISLAGCRGVVLSPMMSHLEPEEQRRVDTMWNNMLTPVDRIDRELLLQVLASYPELQAGADKTHIVAEKQFSGGRVVMEVDCDRVNPSLDQFTFTVLDDRGRTVRRERYSRSDTETVIKTIMGNPPTQPTTAPATEPETQPVIRAEVHVAIAPPTRPAEETPEMRKWRVEFEKRMARIAAATQPAVIPK